MDLPALGLLRPRRLAVIAAFLLVGCEAVVVCATREPQPLSYVGRVVLGAPHRNGDRVSVPITFEGGKWGENSGFVPCGVETTVDGRSILITVATSLPPGDGAGPTEITVPHLAAGSYIVIYRDPDGSLREIGSIEVPGLR